MSANYYLDIGNQLKKQRLELKKEIKDLAVDSRISEAYIEAIEAGDIKSFPSIVYYNLFARAYARELGLEPEKIFVMSSEETVELEKVEALGEDVSAEELRGLDVQVDEPEKSVGSAVFWIVGIGLVIIAAVMIFYYTRSADQDTTPEQVDSTANIVVGNMEEGDDTPGEVEAQMNSEKPEAAEEKIEKEPEATPPPTTREEQRVQRNNPESKQPPIRLRLDFLDSSWVFVMADGDTVLDRTLGADDFRSLQANEQFEITVFHPNRVNLLLNGKPMKGLSPVGRPIRSLIIDRNNMEQFYLENASEESGE